MKQFSYIPSIITPDHWVVGNLGSMTKTVIRPDGQWLDVVPPFEPQSKGFETCDCTGFGLLNDVEILAKVLGFDFNLSDRFMGIVAGTSIERGGNDPHTVAEALRKCGAIAEADLPFDDTIHNAQEFYSFKGNDEQTCRDAGISFTLAWTFNHQWVFNNPTTANKQDLMKEYLQYSPLGVAGYAWNQDPNTKLYITIPGVRSDNHWFTVVGYVDGQYWIVDDSYLRDGTDIKHLAWDYDFGCAKWYTLSRNAVWHSTWYGSVLTGILRFLGL